VSVGAGVGGAVIPGTAYLVFGSAQPFPDNAELESLAPSRAIRIDGVSELDEAGRQVAGAGDVNGDGFDDLLIAAPEGHFFGGGSAYLVFGRSGGGGPIALSQLNGQTGMRIQGGQGLGDHRHLPLAGLGDINGDGFDDFAVGAPSFDAASRGSAFVIYGKAGGFPATLDVAALNGANGFRIAGPRDDFRLGDSIGPAGDVNGDGLADFVVSAEGETAAGRSAAYVIFGSTGARPAVLDPDSLTGANGFRVSAPVFTLNLGASVGSAGDINGDGFDDLAISEIFELNETLGGSLVVVFGKAGGFPASIDAAALNGADGFRLDAPIFAGGLGMSSATGDVNGDGLSDLLGGAPQRGWIEGSPGAPVGHAYLLLGQAAGPSTTGDDTWVGAAGVDHFNGLAGNDVLRGQGGSDFLRGGPGIDRAVYLAAASNYEWWSMRDGAWRVKDLRAGSPDGTDHLTDVERLTFAGETTKILGLTTAESLTGAYANILRSTPTGAEATFLNGLITAVTGATKTRSAAIGEIVAKADQTTAVAAMSYQFFLGFTPSKSGFDYLVSPQGPNPNNINSAYYQGFNIENRYINFAVNLGKVGEGATSFLAEYGSKSLFQATKDAYMEIFGGTVTDTKINTILDTT
jgi:hypothetical protein